MNRRTFLLASAGAATVALPGNPLNVASISAQEPGAFAGLGLPELTITLTDAGYQVAPETTPAGWTLVTFVDQQAFGDNSADVIKVPDGMTVEGMTADLTAAATGGPIPDWVFQAVMVGAPWTAAGTSAQGVIQLSPGEWMISNGGAPIPPTSVTVTGEPAAAATPAALAASTEIGLTEYAFTGLDQPIPAGAQVWKVTNIGAQPHLMNINEVPDGTTSDQLMNSWMALFSGTPTADALAPDQMPNKGGCSTLSRGESIFLALDLPAGTYGATCFFPDEGDGMPHMMKGMITIFTVV